MRTKRGAGRLAERLERRGVRAAALHGDMSQTARRTLARSASRRATPTRSWRPTSPPAASTSTSITHVVNFDPPDDDDTYVHRVGRTGRAGRTGTGITLVLEDERDRVAKMARKAGVEASCERTLEPLAQKTAPSSANFRRMPGRAYSGSGGGRRSGRR